MTNLRNIEDVEAIRDELNKQIALGNALEKLRSNEDFKELILKVFIEDMPKYAMTDLISQNEIVRGQGLDKIKAAKYLEAFFEVVEANAEASKMELANG